MTDHLPRLTGDQIRQLLAAEETGTYPDCFTCGQPVTTVRATLHYGMEEERRVVTMFPCGHRMSYNVRVAEQMQARAATEATELTDEDSELEALRRQVAAARELHKPLDDWSWAGFGCVHEEKHAQVCGTCKTCSPCATLRALEGDA